MPVYYNYIYIPQVLLTQKGSFNIYIFQLYDAQAVGFRFRSRLQPPAQPPALELFLTLVGNTLTLLVLMTTGIVACCVKLKTS